VKLVLTLLIATFFGACPEVQASDFIITADRFLTVEVAKMEAAVTAKDRKYFDSGLERVKIFVEENWADLEKSPPCTNAITDFLIVGLCQISPPGSICEPKTFIPKFEANLAMCRAAAKSTQALQPSLGR
jgi:hypothetical protein